MVRVWAGLSAVWAGAESDTHIQQANEEILSTLYSINKQSCFDWNEERSYDMRASLKPVTLVMMSVNF